MNVLNSRLVVSILLSLIWCSRFHLRFNEKDCPETLANTNGQELQTKSVDISSYIQ